ncbi:histidine kinase [Paenibacillus sp. HN-1]|uniref:cache domain-containing sensor histidine kinase n=1 Tax=Paenibacillus TaxID=44249 RepID=UPI001CA9AC54|nr:MULTISPECIES: histidine kinase [Paenibacillus]MBY9078542.1 histidine kinase [Paenibacillus sp. CGMCC 1.18879]MBY9082718.1 histidine kinase [Paenibacillus sinensis]
MKWNSIRTKLIVFLLLPTLVFTIATMFISYSYTTKSLRTRAVDENKNLLFQGYRNIDSLIGELNRSSLLVYSDSEFYRLMEAGYDDMAADIRIYAFLNYISTSMPDITQVYLYGVKDQKATLVTQATPKRWQDASPYPASRIKGTEPFAVQSTHMSHIYGLSAPFPEFRNEAVFTIHRRIEQIPSTRPLGYLSIDVKLSALTEIVEQLYDREKERIYLIDDTGQIVYANQTESFGTKLDAEWYSKQIAGKDAEQGFFEQDNAVFIYQRINSPGLNWTLVKQIPVSYLFREANEAVFINMMLLGLLLILITSVIILISFRITAPIKQLARYMNQVQTGNLNIDIRPGGKDEIGFVTERFRSMMDTINNLILREYRLELSNRTNELRALQAQINPHFLNNTLQIIGTLALELKVPQIYALLSALAKMMRYSMYNDEKIVTVRDEFEHVKAYLELQRERFENNFTFRYHMEEDIAEAAMPKMILQPIVENYFKHGFNRSMSGGIIELNAARIGMGRMAITIWNNGKPIPPERLERLRQELESPTESMQDRAAAPQRLDAPGSGIGLANVLARLRLVCGDSASLTVSSSSEGVMVRLEIEISTESEQE